MTAKERRKVKHALKTSVDTADLWLKLANDVKNALGIDAKELRESNSNSKELLISELEKSKKEISECYSKFMAEIESSIASLK